MFQAGHLGKDILEAHAEGVADIFDARNMKYLTDDGDWCSMSHLKQEG